MNPLRDQAIAILSWSISELDGCVMNLEGHDNRAVAVIRAARPHLTALRDRYADGAPTPLPALAAQELRELSDLLEKIGTESGNQYAERDLKHESDRISHFIMSHNVMVDSDARYQFDRTVVLNDRLRGSEGRVSMSFGDFFISFVSAFGGLAVGVAALRCSAAHLIQLQISKVVAEHQHGLDKQLTSVQAQLSRFSDVLGKQAQRAGVRR